MATVRNATPKDHDHDQCGFSLSLSAKIRRK
jgi:hypothetical protein